MRNCQHKKIIANILLSVFSFFLSASQVQAVTVSNVEVNPSSPVWGQKFECILTVDVDDSNLACDLLPVNAPDTQKPLDICPKRNGLGHQRTEGNRRYYNCLADSSTGVPGPGNYRIVAWHFYSDGAYGDVIYSKNIQILNVPPPTNTPYPTLTPISTPTRVPTISTGPVISPYVSPTVIFNPTSFIRPTVFFPTGRNASAFPVPTNSSRPIFTSWPDFSGLIKVNIAEKVSGAVNTVKDGTKDTYLSVYGFLKKVIINFINETSF
ncbi:hypothetical protein HY338_01250 [Candidatus Gottesmanbacteria bacterium]|nr:hypothetical protein [Candidatus Gottesmanbacteria bacterium]